MSSYEASDRAGVIGGYLGLADHSDSPPAQLHPDGVAVNSGRNALKHALMSNPEIRHLHLPLYICPAVLGPLDELGVSYSFYSIEASLDPLPPAELREGEAVVAVNYFGICSPAMARLAARYPGQLIVDASRAFYYRPPSRVIVSNSARKPFGVPEESLPLGVARAVSSGGTGSRSGTASTFPKTWMLRLR